MSRDDYLRRQAWDYFALHAQQRLTTVNFYLVMATALTAGAVASFDESFRFPGLRLPTGLLLSLLSFAFWRLDFRNRELIKAAEAALRSFEAGDRVDDGNEEHWSSGCSREITANLKNTRERLAGRAA